MRRVLAILTLLCALAASAGFGGSAQAAVLIALELTELVAQSDYVVVAHPEGQSARYADGLIVTDVTLRVISALKGPTQPGGTLIATHLGGAVDRVGLSVPGAAHFTPGRSAIVFLRRVAHSNDLNVTGMSQGVMPILGDGPTARVQPGGDRAALMQRNAAGTFVSAPDSMSRRRTLSAVVAEIEQLVSPH